MSKRSKLSLNAAKNIHRGSTILEQGALAEIEANRDRKAWNPTFAEGIEHIYQKTSKRGYKLTQKVVDNPVSSSINPMVIVQSMKYPGAASAVTKRANKLSSELQVNPIEGDYEDDRSLFLDARDQSRSWILKYMGWQRKKEKRLGINQPGLEPYQPPRDPQSSSLLVPVPYNVNYPMNQSGGTAAGGHQQYQQVLHRGQRELSTCPTLTLHDTVSLTRALLQIHIVTQGTTKPVPPAVHPNVGFNGQSGPSNLTPTVSAATILQPTLPTYAVYDPNGPPNYWIPRGINPIPHFFPATTHICQILSIGRQFTSAHPIQMKFDSLLYHPDRAVTICFAPQCSNNIGISQLFERERAPTSCWAGQIVQTSAAAKTEQTRHHSIAPAKILTENSHGSVTFNSVQFGAGCYYSIDNIERRTNGIA
ncbi:uncharacterized protein BT62DRAFT_924047 [Guyanagaster necrorhizus]|uniref:Uncharacterized protein n=1 Tax=Guyanagaster necrorhizus TaxID=856835 RepID=A0A9P8ALM7_9AGAR|nr:uncharacterized protein BT62DRAFT_924047 [Guyanagaster necrorhizus MCA 3950]KAG7440373.1 hypothetical protein BT62DRAFT_924047 [Guyanagaster necrorhizus MCA 3950]